MEITQIQATLLAVLISLFALFFSLRANRIFVPLTSVSKLWDRQNELDRLIVTNPALGKAFMSMANRKEPYFTAPSESVPRDDLYYQLKAFTYLQLNFFEEIYLTTSASKTIAAQFEREHWDTFIFEKMRHALLREVFNAEKGRTYTGAFPDFLSSNSSEWPTSTSNDTGFF